jgi:hypothetical protein
MTALLALPFALLAGLILREMAAKTRALPRFLAACGPAETVGRCKSDAKRDLILGGLRPERK